MKFGLLKSHKPGLQGHTVLKVWRLFGGSVNINFFFRGIDSSISINLKDQVSLITIDILKYLFEAPNQRFAQVTEQRDCLGRRLCQISQKSQKKISSTMSLLETVMFKLTRSDIIM